MRKLRKQKAIIGLCGLLVAVLLNSAAAYFTDGDTSVNHFTIGKVEVAVTEPAWDEAAAKSLIPYETISKDPTIANTASVDVLAGLRVDGVMELVESNFIIGMMDSGGYGLQNGENEVFCWDAAFTLVDRDGNPLSYGEDHALTTDELTAICSLSENQSDVPLYFAYNSVLKAGDDSTPLFTGVQNMNAEDSAAQISVVPFFTKEDGTALYMPVTETEFTEGLPATDADGNYIYKYKITVSGAFLSEAYDSYEDAEKVAAQMMLEKEAYFKLKVQAAGIQAENSGIGDTWTNTDKWYAQLPADF